MDLIWKNTDVYLNGITPNFKMGEKIASFDLDNTLIKTKSKKKFPYDENDWVWNYDSVPTVMRDLAKDGFSIVIISNQAGCDENDKKIQEWMTKLSNIVKELNIEMQVLVAITKDSYRKPQTRFADEFFPKKINKESFYCGDAAGRNEDHADSDYKFAKSANLSFKLPENVFLGEKNDLPPIEYPIDFKNKPKPFTLNFTPNKNKEIIIMVGYPGSGKSSVSKILEEKYDYVVINQDTLKTKTKCIKATENAIKSNKSLVIDSTNPSKEKRKVFIDLAKKNGYAVRVIQMTTTLEHAKHNNCYRALTQGAQHVPDIAYNMYKSKFEEPDLLEDIDEIIKQDPGYPDDKIYFKYLI